MRNVLNRIFSSKAFYIVFSVIVAIVLWVFVEITENQVQSVIIPDIPVVFVGDEVLRDRGYFVSSQSPQTVRITFDASRAAAATLSGSEGEFMVQIDVSRITPPHERAFSTLAAYEVIYPEGFDQNQVTITSQSVERISLFIDILTSRQIRVEAPYTGGTASDEFIVESTIVEPSIITVHGPGDMISRISSARVRIPHENISMTVVDDLPFVILDDDGEELELEPEEFSQLFFSSNDMPIDAIRVTVPVSMTKLVPLSVEIMPGAGASRDNINITYNPTEVQLSGDPDILRALNSIELGTIDLTRFELSTTEQLPIIIPNDIINESGQTQATVLIEVRGLEIDYYSVENLHTINAPPNYDVVLITQSVDPRVRGRREDLDILAELMLEGGQNIRVVADLTDLGPGTTRLPSSRVRIFIDGVDVDIGAVGDYRVSVRITED